LFFAHSKLRKQPFFAKIFKIHGGLVPPLSDAHAYKFSCLGRFQTQHVLAQNHASGLNVITVKTNIFLGVPYIKTTCVFKNLKVVEKRLIIGAR